MRYQDAWLDATVESVRNVAAAVREITLRPAPDAPPYSPGSHINLRVLIDGRTDTRSYSLVGEPADGLYRIAVKAEAASRGGSRYMWSLRPGARLEITPPTNAFELAQGAPELLLIAGGIGITPLRGMAQRLRRSGARFRLLYAARARSEMAYLAELTAELGEALQVFASDEGARIDLPGAVTALHPDGELYVCGPLRLLDGLRRVWAEAGRAPARLRYETFGSSGHFAPEAFTVRIPRLGREVAVAANSSMLEALEAAGVGVLADCRRGECGLCVMQVLAVDGRIDHRDVFLSAHQQARGDKICTCVSRVVGGAITVEPAYRP
jgi:vanillate O-demethylase ferredoxin subunit